jgi:hypothetical protein
MEKVLGQTHAHLLRELTLQVAEQWARRGWARTGNLGAHGYIRSAARTKRSDD